MSNGGQSGWILDYGLAEEEMHGSEFLWNPQLIDDPTVSSVIFGFDVSRKEDSGQDNACPRKRTRQESCAAPGTKACREKIRRDKLNERFMELCSVLEPGKPPKADKVAILNDATRMLSQLHAEAQKLKKSNESLQENIKNLKAEKSVLRDEKTKLKAEKERIEQMLKVPNASPQFVPTQMHFVPQSKFVAYANYPPQATFWQWIPPVSLDTSKDPVLWPPVA